MDTNPDIYFDNFLIFPLIANEPPEDKVANEEFNVKY